jgi:hypothetical protein
MPMDRACFRAQIRRIPGRQLVMAGLTISRESDTANHQPFKYAYNAQTSKTAERYAYDAYETYPRDASSQAVHHSYSAPG